MIARRLRLPVVLLLALVVHTAVLPRVRVAGASPDLMLLFSICAGLVAGAERGALVGFFCGIAADLFLQTPIGLSALTYSLIAFSVGLVQGTILRLAFWIAPLTALGASAAGVIVFVLAGAVVGQAQLISSKLLVIAASVSVLNALMSPVVVRVVRWSVPAPDVGAKPVMAG